MSMTFITTPPPEVSLCQMFLISAGIGSLLLIINDIGRYASCLRDPKLILVSIFLMTLEGFDMIAR